MIRWISKKIYHFMGWRLQGRFPSELKKKILIVAPHTSKMDFLVGILVKFWLDIRVTFYAKEELFKGVVGWFLRSLGGTPVDRSKKNNLVARAIRDFKEKEIHGILLTPEGTRRRVDKWKSGFYHIAEIAQVPIIPIAFDFEHKKIIIFPTYFVKGEGETEIEEIRGLFKGIKGKVPEFGVF